MMGSATHPIGHGNGFLVSLYEIMLITRSVEDA